MTAQTSTVKIIPTLDRKTLTDAHVLLTKLEGELRDSARGAEADMLAYVDLVILTLRNVAEKKAQNAAT